MYHILNIGSKQEAEEDDIQGKRAEIRRSEKAAKIEYGRFLYCAGKLMEKAQVYLPDVKVTWSGYDSEMSCDACEAKDIPSFLMAIRGNQGPYAYENIGALLILFCEKEGEKLVEEYEKKLKCQLRPRVMPVKRTGKKFKVKIDKELGQGSRSSVLDFRNTLATLFECRAIDFLFEDIRDGCIEMIYIVPSDLTDKLRNYSNLRAKQKEFKKAKILEIWLQRYTRTLLHNANIHGATLLHATKLHKSCIVYVGLYTSKWIVYNACGTWEFQCVFHEMFFLVPAYGALYQHRRGR